MDSFLMEYERHKLEINAYIELLGLMELDGAKIIDVDGFSSNINNLSFKVSKASFYLVIYNLIEATVTEGIRSIYNRIEDESLSFFDIEENIRKIWWHSKSESLTSCSKNTLVDNIYSFYCEAHSNNKLDFNEFISGVSGNLDSEGVREVCRRYGIDSIPDGRDLKDVKSNRNWLAHGNKSFSEVGREKTISDLKEIRNRVFEFLDKYVENVNSYLNRSGYKCAI